MSDTATAPVRLGQKRLSTIDCVAQSLAVGPVFSAALLGAILTSLAGGVGPFTIILTVIGVLGIGWTVSEFAKRYAGSGTVYEFIAQSLGKRAAVFTAGSYYIAVLALAAVGIPLVGGMLLRAFLSAHAGLDLPWWLCSIAVAAIVLIVNTIGVDVSVRTQLAVIIVSLIPFVILSVKVISSGGVAGNSTASFNPSNVADGGSVFKGLLFAILMFVGFELAAALGEETADPKRSIPRAVLVTIAIVFVVFLVTQYVIAIGSGGEGDAAIPPFFDVMGSVYVGRWLQIWIELAIILDVLAVGIGFCLAGSRGLFTLSRDGLLPRKLANVNRRDQPVVANMTVFAVGVVGIFVALIKYGTETVLDDAGNPVLGPVPEKAFLAFLVCATIGALIICISYVLLCVGALKTFATRRPVDLVAAVVGLAIAGLGVAAQFIDGTAPTGDAKWGIYIGLIALAGSLAWAAAAKRSAVDQVGQHIVHH